MATERVFNILGLEDMDPVLKAQGIQNSLRLCGVLATLWFVSFVTADGDFSSPETGYKRSYLFSVYFRAFYWLAVVCLYGFFAPNEAFQPNQLWLFRILFVLLLQYQLFATVALHGANDSCKSPPWQTDMALILHSISEPALDCWLLLISQGWGTSIFDGSRFIFVAAYGILQFLRRFADPIMMFKFGHVLCKFDHDTDYQKQQQDVQEMQTLIKERDELAYVDFALCIIYWSACLYWAVQSYYNINDAADYNWNKTYLYLLPILGVLGGTDVAAYMMEVFFMDWGLISPKSFFVVLQIIEYLQMALIAAIIWLWRPQTHSSFASERYAQVPSDDQDPTFNYLELQEGRPYPQDTQTQTQPQPNNPTTYNNHASNRHTGRNIPSSLLMTMTIVAIAHAQDNTTVQLPTPLVSLYQLQDTPQNGTAAFCLTADNCQSNQPMVPAICKPLNETETQFYYTDDGGQPALYAYGVLDDSCGFKPEPYGYCLSAESNWGVGSTVSLVGCNFRRSAQKFTYTSSGKFILERDNQRFCLGMNFGPLYNNNNITLMDCNTANLSSITWRVDPLPENNVIPDGPFPFSQNSTGTDDQQSSATNTNKPQPTSSPTQLLQPSIAPQAQQDTQPTGLTSDTLDLLSLYAAGRGGFT